MTFFDGFVDGVVLGLFLGLFVAFVVIPFVVDVGNAYLRHHSRGR